MPADRDVRDLLAAYALDALDPQQRAEVEQVLAVDDDARAEVAGFQEAAAMLGAAASEEPPPALRAAVLAAAARTPQDSAPPVVEPDEALDEPADTTRGTGPDAAPDTAPRTAATPELPPRAQAPTSPPSPPSPPSRPGAPRTARSRWLLTLAAGLALVAGALGVVVVQQQRQLDTVAAQAERVAAVLADPTASTATAPVAGGGSARVVTSTRLDTAVVVLDALPALPAEQTYQLWLVGPERVTSAGVLGPATAPAQPLVRAVPVADDVTTVALSVEPAGGSPQPTTDPVLLLEVGA
jgi:anti-sigma-K factor RskA